ncbi:MAG: dUTP diphosphatase [Clostridia bacterium]|nr:dUTP diphosphatase [Clostridia bacterium]
MKVRIKKLTETAIIPTYGSENAAGADLYACLESEISIEPGATYLVHTGLSMEIPVGFAGFIYARSSLGTKRGLAPANKVGVIDADYRGEIMVSLFNQSKEPQTILPGERIAQIVIAPVNQVIFEESETLEDTKRGAGGFGSTGRK